MDHMRAFSNWRRHVDDVFVKINGERHLYSRRDFNLFRTAALEERRQLGAA